MKSIRWLALIALVCIFQHRLFAVGNIAFTPELYAKVKQEYGDNAVERVEDWQEMMEDVQGDDEEEKVYEVNRFFNSLPFVDDIDHWHQKDYWATPIEFLGTNGGDCEDFTIAKYFSLRALGVAEEKLRFMYVKALKYNQAHMVLAYYPEPDAVPLVLDNINKRILPAFKRRDLLPVYSFNGSGLWLAKAQGRGKQLSNGPKHNMWDDLTTRIERDYKS